MTEVSEAIKNTVQYALSLEKVNPIVTPPIAEAQNKTAEISTENAETQYAEMDYLDLWLQMRSGEITDPAAAKVYLEKEKQHNLDIELRYAERHPEDNRRPLDIVTAEISAKYDQYINGTNQDRARFFALEAQSMLLHNTARTEDNPTQKHLKAKANGAAAHYLSYAGILAGQGVQPEVKAHPQDQTQAKIQTVRAELAQTAK